MTLEVSLLKQQAFLNKNMMGSISDKDYFMINRRQRKINNHFSNKDWSDYHCRQEVKRLLSQLKLSHKLEPQILKRFYIYYNQIPKWYKFRRIEYLIPLTIYIVARENFIFIRKDLLISKIKVPSHQDSKKFFKEGLGIILKNNPGLMKLFRRDQFRKTYILNFMIRFFPLNKVWPILESEWGTLKRTKDTMIMGILLYLLLPFGKRSHIIKESLSISSGSVCNFIKKYKLRGES